MAVETNIEDDFLAGNVIPGDLDFAAPGDGRTPIADLDDDEDNILGEGEEEEEEEETDNKDTDLGEGDDDPDNPGDDDPAKDPAGHDNEFYLVAKVWQERGRLSPDFELDPKMSQLDLEELRIKQTEKDVLNRIKTQISDKLSANGVDPDKIFNEKSQEEYFRDQYAVIASLTYDGLLEKSSDITSTLKNIGTEYWIAKSSGTLEPDDVAPNVEKDLNENTEEELLVKYQKFFDKESKRLDSKIKEDAALKASEAADKVRNDAIYIKQKLASGQIGNKKYSPEQIAKVINGMQVEDQIFDDGKGTRRRVTLFEKKRLEKSSTLDKQLEYAVNLILEDEDPAITKEKEKRVHTVDTLSRLADVVTSSHSDKNKKPTNKKQAFADESDFL